MADETTFNAGDRVEYPDMLRFQLGAQRTNHAGVVVDVVRGDGGQVELVFTSPDEPFNVLLDGEAVRMDVVVKGVSPSLRKLSPEEL